MNENLKKLLQEEVNYSIYEMIKDNSPEKIENYFHGLYKWIDFIEKNTEDPLKTFGEVKKRAENLDSFIERKSFIQFLKKILVSKTYNAWQVKKIQSYMSNYLMSLKSEQSLKETGKILSTSIKMIGDAFDKKQDTEIQVLKSILNNKKAKSKENIYDIKLFRFITDRKDVSEKIKLIHERLIQASLIKVEYKYFERHFFDNKSEYVNS